MGMSASQVRYLTLTSRIHDVENEAQRIQNQKLLLANDSDAVYDTYLAALDKKKLLVRQFDDISGTSKNIDVTLEAIYKYSADGSLANSYALTGVDGSLYLPFAVTADDLFSHNTFAAACADYYGVDITANNPWAEKADFTELQWANITAMWNHINEVIGAHPLTRPYGPNDQWVYPADTDNYVIKVDNFPIDSEIKNKRLAVIHSINLDDANDNKWINDIISNGYANFQLVSELPTKINVATGDTTFGNGASMGLPCNECYMYLNTFSTSSVSTDTQMSEVSDDILVAQAEVQYEADMKKINNKDKKYDNELSRLENQRSAMKEELDSLTKVIDENIDRTFKLFS